MTDLPILGAPSEELFLVGFRIDPSWEGPQFHTLFACGGENDRPITTENGQIVFFPRPELAPQALELGDEAMRKLPIPEDLGMLCDVAQSLYLVNSESPDEDHVILDCLEIFDGLLRATRLNLPVAYRELLGDLSEHLTHTPQPAGFWQEGKREQVEDALLWCVGAIAMKAKMVVE